MVADAIIYHPSVSHYLRFVATTVGRDKLLRVVQYFARFYAWYLYRTNGTRGEIAPYEALKKQLALARKLLRVGKNVEHLRAAAVAADAIRSAATSTKKAGGAGAGDGDDPVLQYATLGRQLGYAGYLTFDSATVLDALGARKWSGAKRLQKEAYRFWAMGLLCSIVAQTYTLYRLREREAKVDKKEGEGVVESKRIAKERATSQLQLVSDLCDLTVPTAALGWINLDDGLVGLAGTVSSLIGIYLQWKKTA
ncbi:peroxisomal biogenesis factor 11 [Daldinia caldariorum]|uniref:peroxisomal biogenesis factor 11 n=1 Tax=Daldinia caldariorum TaxID=326644 RepID=UPI0020088F79|nr:peroxisomal biogenesis factor 11 [Daldinia caldariorum]KAI1473244.1 peroxisomal biogenesis factor 11 [Daldinia caldariorum]